MMVFGVGFSNVWLARHPYVYVHLVWHRIIQ